FPIPQVQSARVLSNMRIRPNHAKYCTSEHHGLGDREWLDLRRQEDGIIRLAIHEYESRAREMSSRCGRTPGCCHGEPSQFHVGYLRDAVEPQRTLHCGDCGCSRPAGPCTGSGGVAWCPGRGHGRRSGNEPDESSSPAPRTCHETRVRPRDARRNEKERGGTGTAFSGNEKLFAFIECE